MVAPLVERGLVHGKDHVPEGDRGGAHAETNAREDAREPATTRFKGVIAADQRSTADQSEGGAEEGEGGGPEVTKH